MDYFKLANIIEKAAEKEISKKAAHVRLGTVSSVSGNVAAVVIDGSDEASDMVKACSCVAGDRVVILRQGTQFYAIAKVGG